MNRYISLFLTLALTAALLTSCGRDAKDDTLDTNSGETSGMTDQTSHAATKVPDSESETGGESDTEDVTKEDTTPAPLPVVDPFADYTRLYDDTIDTASIIGDAGMNDSEMAEMVFDDDVTTKWCVRPTAEDGSIRLQWALTNPETLVGYAFITANDSPDRNPDAWALYGAASPDGDWTLLSEVTGAALPKDVFTESEVFPIDAPTAYQYYMLHITNNLNERDLYQFSELVLLTK